MRFVKPILFLFGLCGLVVLAGCRASTPGPTPTPISATQPSRTATAPQATPTASPVPPRALVVCLQQEPSSLYLYGSSSRSTWSVLEGVYDGPFDTRGFSVQPVILQKIPQLIDGDAAFAPVAVKDGDPVVDAEGSLVALHKGVKVLPSGCSGPDCAAAWDGKSDLMMDQLTVKFQLKPGITWSDGQPLTAADSVFSYEIAAHPDTPTSKFLTDRTASYTAVNDQTTQWVGLPGYYEQRYGTFFWSPLPKHTLGSKSAKDLLTDAEVAKSPLGWGAYTVQEWVAGDHITLQKNPNYFRAAEGLPKFDTLVYRFVGDAADGNLNALLSGECDVLDQNEQFLGMYTGLQDRQNEKKLQIFTGQGPEWEHLDFGITPAVRDSASAAPARPDFFGDVRTRQAFAYCIDRAKINQTLLFGQALVPDSYLPPSHPLYQKNLPAYAFNPTQGAKLLDEVGWKDADNNPDTPRVAAGVAGVPDGTPFTVTYFTTPSALRQQVSLAAADSLKSCGVQANVMVVNPGDVFGPGPDGLVFGRKFDLVQFSWEASARPNCLLYTTSQIPNPDNHWIGANVTGYANSEFDQACASAFWARPNEADFAQRNIQAQEIFARDLPVLPLYAFVKVAIGRPDLCGLKMDVTARSMFWNIEELDYGSRCP